MSAVSSPTEEHPLAVGDALRWRWLIVCFILSGAAGLIYQTAWMQELSLVFGASELAVAAVLAAYMAGLTSGALLMERWLDRVERPLRLYALLELAIAVSALMVPMALGLASRARVWLFAGSQIESASGPASALFYLLCTFCALSVPTACMGATLPLLTRWAVRSDRQLGPRLAILYGANTAGAAAGTLIAAFWLLPAWGLGSTVWAAIGINGTVFLLALLMAGDRLSRTDKVPSSEVPSSEVPSSEVPSSEVPSSEVAAEVPSAGRPSAAAASSQLATSGAARNDWILPAIAASGFVAFGWEILWTRLLSHLMGGSIYAFGLMLATFLVGIAGGSMIAAPQARDTRRARLGFVIAQLGVALASWLAFIALDSLALGLDPRPGQSRQMAALVAVTLLPGALMMGGAFPCAVRLLARDAGDAGRASARVYAWNTLGAILGSIAVGFFLLPTLRYAGLVTLLVATSLSLALLGATVRSPRKPWLGGMAVAGLLVLLWMRPVPPWQVLRTAPISGRAAAGEVAFYAVGRSSTVLLLREGHGVRLTTNGLPESVIEAAGARAGRLPTASWLGLLPVIGRPEVESMLIVGLGGGVTANSVPGSVREIHIVELEPEVAAANALTAGWRDRDPLADPRVQLHFDDARSALQLTTRSFDAIVSQPSHPWTAGASHLFSREFFDLARGRLSDRGVFVQWIGLRFVDEPLVRSLVATLLDVFPQLEVYSPPPGGALLFMASRAPLADLGEREQGFQLARSQWQRIGIAGIDQVLLAQHLDTAGSRAFAMDGELTTDRNNLLQTRSPHLLRAPERLNSGKLFAEDDVLLAAMRSPDSVTIVRRLLSLGRVPRARQLAGKIEARPARQIAQALLLLQAGQPGRGEALLQEALGGECPADDLPVREAAGALLRLGQRSLIQGNPPRLLDLARRCGADFEAVVEGWRQSALRNPSKVRVLEPELAALTTNHPLHRAAVNLRIAWRLQTNESKLHREALDFLEASMPARPAEGRMLLQRVVLAAGAGERAVLDDGITELVGFGVGKRRRVLRRAQELLADVSTDGALSIEEVAAASQPLRDALVNSAESEGAASEG